MKATVSFVSQNPPKWKTANGYDIYNGSGFSDAPVAINGSLNVTLRDPANPPYEGSVTVNASDEGTQAHSAGGARLVFSVKHKAGPGGPPPPYETLPKAPSKSSISEKLR
jgi:hypothetical protein